MGLLYRSDAAEIGLSDNTNYGPNVSWGQIYFSLAALAYLLADCCGNITDEYAYIWRLRLGLTKLIYMAVRYLSVIFQAVMLGLAIHSQAVASRGPRSHHVCKRTFIYQTISIYTIYVLAYMYNARRIYDLYLRSRTVLISLTIAAIAEAAVSLVLVPISINQLVFNAFCNSTNVPPTVVVLLLAKIFSQVTMWIVIYYKSHQRIHGSKEGSGAIGNTWLRFSIYVVVLVCLPISAFKQQYVRPDFMFSWPMAMWSYSTCTSILDDQKESETLSQKQNDLSARAFVTRQLFSSSSSTAASPTTDVSYLSDLTQSGRQSTDYAPNGVMSSHMVFSAPGQVWPTAHANEDPERSPRESLSIDIGDRSEVMSTLSGSFGDDELSLDDRIEIGSMHSCSTSNSTFDYKRAWARSASVLSA